MQKYCLTLFLFLAALAANAQTVDEILANYFDNIGGREAWEQLESTKMTSTMNMQQMEFPGTIFAARPNKQRVEVNLQGKQLIQAYDGETAWWINPFMGSEEPQKMPEAMAEEMTRQEFEIDFINYQEKGYTVSLEGPKTVEGAETFEIKLEKEDGDVYYYYFDQEYFVPIMMKTTLKSGQAKGQESETFFSDYQEVDGMMFPFFIESKIGGQSFQKITIDSIELNFAYEDDFFAFPEMAEEEQKETSEGKGN